MRITEKNYSQGIFLFFFWSSTIGGWKWPEWCRKEAKNEVSRNNTCISFETLDHSVCITCVIWLLYCTIVESIMTFCHTNFFLVSIVVIIEVRKELAKGYRRKKWMFTRNLHYHIVVHSNKLNLLWWFCNINIFVQNFKILKFWKREYSFAPCASCEQEYVNICIHSVNTKTMHKKVYFCFMRTRCMWNIRVYFREYKNNQCRLSI